MPINFQEEKKKQKLLIIVIVVIILITITVLWFGVLKNGESTVVVNIRPTNLIKEINIDLNVLEDNIFNEVKPFELIPSFEGERGRENPFLPY